jgi:hypothetical protein
MGTNDRHPGLDPGSMNTGVRDYLRATVFMDRGFRRDDGSSIAAHPAHTALRPRPSNAIGARGKRVLLRRGK